MAFKLVCGDVLQFQVKIKIYFLPKTIFACINFFKETLKSMRDLDDKIIYALNVSLPTESMAKRSQSNPEKNCRDLYETLRNGYADRDRVIKECINVTAEHVKNLKKQRDEDMGNSELEKKFKSEQRKVSKFWDLQIQ
jgi:hypothetical protein